MATVYKCSVTSHWISYTEEEMQQLLNEAIKDICRKTRNEITIEIINK
jgi:hypothetical protein